MPPCSRYFQIDGFELHAIVAGPPDAPAVVLSHGLARSAQDFEALTGHLAGRWRVVALDMIGRGYSQWSRAPQHDYCLQRYAALSAAVLDQLALPTVRWFGTSMGGTIGIRLGGDEPGRITHLVLNDTGPVRAAAALQRIETTIGQPPVVDTLGELEAFYRRLYAACGPRSDEGWRRLTEHSMRRTYDGRYTCQHDPRIVTQFRSHPEDFDLWPWYERIGARTLCIRGALSELLTPEVARAMSQRGPRARVVQLDGLGHAPALDTPAQIELIERFLGE